MNRDSEVNIPFGKGPKWNPIDFSHYFYASEVSVCECRQLCAPFFLCRELTSERGQLWKLLLDSYATILETINNTLHQSRLFNLRDPVENFVYYEEILASIKITVNNPER